MANHENLRVMSFFLPVSDLVSRRSGMPPLRLPNASPDKRTTSTSKNEIFRDPGWLWVRCS
ncbi:MAG TPA: hypothetical protein P5263_09970 [Methanoregulaceae archaeon]|nr:hypothetical protein [Methanoregulaceae archaeon]